MQNGYRTAKSCSGSPVSILARFIPAVKQNESCISTGDEEFWEGQPVGVRFALQVRTQVSGNLYDEQSGGINGEFSDSFRRVTQYNTA